MKFTEIPIEFEGWNQVYLSGKQQEPSAALVVEEAKNEAFTLESSRQQIETLPQEIEKIPSELPQEIPELPLPQYIVAQQTGRTSLSLKLEKKTEADCIHYSPQPSDTLFGVILRFKLEKSDILKWNPHLIGMESNLSILKCLLIPKNKNLKNACFFNCPHGALHPTIGECYRTNANNPRSSIDSGTVLEEECLKSLGGEPQVVVLNEEEHPEMSLPKHLAVNFAGFTTPISSKGFQVYSNHLDMQFNTRVSMNQSIYDEKTMQLLYSLDQPLSKRSSSGKSHNSLWRMATGAVSSVSKLLTASSESHYRRESCIELDALR